MVFSSASSEGDTRAVMAQRKQKRMLSNRESARRSRMRKQKHLDDLIAQVSCFRKENNQILTTLNVTMQRYIGMEAENSLVRTQMLELNSRLLSLNEILHCINCSGGGGSYSTGLATSEDDSFLRPWSPLLLNQALMASDMFQYC